MQIVAPGPHTIAVVPAPHAQEITALLVCFSVETSEGDPVSLRLGKLNPLFRGSPYMSKREPDITVYWRPGCGFCARLLRQLDQHAIPHRRIDIWADPRAGAVVRAAARGNETVPTVTIGPVTLVNPRLDDILTTAREHVPGAVPDDWEPRQPGRFGRWLSAKLNGNAAAA